MNVAVQVFAYDEPAADLSRVFESVNRQEVPEEWSVETEAWVTLAGPTDTSFAVARRHDVAPYSAPRGKLSARNEAHSRAAQRGFDAIVTLDGDAPLLTTDSLRSLLEPLTDPLVVASNSHTVASWTPDGSVSVFGALVDVAGFGEDVVRPHMHGQLSAFTVNGWLSAGPFDTSIDETDIAEVRREEEFEFYNRLSDIGRVVPAPGSKVHNSPRRHFCRMAPSLAPDGYCDRRGAETFAPRD